MAEKHQEMDALMVAMDAIDAMRYEEQKLQEEVLDAAARKARLKARLREIYAASGIEVSEAMLDAGIQAMEEERFGYEAPRKGIAWYLAKLYVRRDRWLKPVVGVFGATLLGVIGYWALVVHPKTTLYAELPKKAQRYEQNIAHEAVAKEAIKEAALRRKEIDEALKRGDTARAKEALARLEALDALLASHYRIRIVQEPGTPSGVWRVPKGNANAKNYYLIVEAIDENGRHVPAEVYDEERGKKVRTTRWGIRVDEKTFRRIAQDKRDDGIIQQREIGEKKRGFLTPHYRIETTGAAITHW